MINPWPILLSFLEQVKFFTKKKKNPKIHANLLYQKIYFSKKRIFENMRPTLVGMEIF